MLSLPLSNSPLRELFDVGVLAQCGTIEGLRKMPTFRQALASARRTYEIDASIRAVHVIAVRAEGNLELIRVGRRGGHRTLWNFGNPLGV